MLFLIKDLLKPVICHTSFKTLSLHLIHSEIRAIYQSLSLKRDSLYKDVPSQFINLAVSFLYPLGNTLSNV